MGIAWVGHIVLNPDPTGEDEYVVDRPGATREEIMAMFPPTAKDAAEGKIYNRAALTRAVILEARDEGIERSRKNVRGFWYERLLHTIGTIMGESLTGGNLESINQTVAGAWKQLTESGDVTYYELNLHSANEKLYHIAVKKDSPYPRSIVIAEKEGWFDSLHDLVDAFGMSFCCTRGKPSRAAVLAYVRQLRQIGIDVSGGPFTIYSFCDFDPEGWTIPINFADMLRIDGDVQEVNIVRIGVLREHISDNLLKYQGSPYPMDQKSDRAKKGTQTKWNNFVEATGGLYMPGTDIPARVELDPYSAEQVRERILRGLAAHIDGFEYQVEGLELALEQQHSKWENGLDYRAQDAVDRLLEPYQNAVDEQMDRLRVARAGIGPSLQRQIKVHHEELERLHLALRKQIKDSGIHGEIEVLRDWTENVRDVSISWTGEQKSLEELRENITDNGGWRGWAEELDLQIIDADILVKRARAHRGFSYETTVGDDGKIFEWIDDECDMWPEAWVEGPDPFTDLDPDALVELIVDGRAEADAEYGDG